MVSLLLSLNIFHTCSTVSIVNYEQVNFGLELIFFFQFVYPFLFQIPRKRTQSISLAEKKIISISIPQDNQFDDSNLSSSDDEEHFVPSTHVANASFDSDSSELD